VPFKKYTVVVTNELIDAMVEFNFNPGFNAKKNGEKFGWLQIGKRITIATPKIAIEPHAGLHGGRYIPLIGGVPYSGFCSIGSFSYSYSCLPEPVKVGRYCSISTGLKFLDSTHPITTLTTSAALFRIQNKLFTRCQTPQVESFSKRFRAKGDKPYPEIGHDVWIGHGVTLAMGIKIGTGAIIAANSTVVRDVPPYAIVGGNPAQIIKMRFEPSLVENLLKSQWWEFDPQEIFSLDFTNPQSVCEEIGLRNLTPYRPNVFDLAQFAEEAPTGQSTP
jgi:acetyltransferase-like isoleucine patch superfamily enzyme